MSKSNYVIFGLPRSRTFWLSRALAYGDWQCGHDEIRHARSLDDVRAWLGQPHTGTVETAASPFWRLLPPDVRVLTIRRPVDGVMASLARLGFTVDRRLIQRLDAKLDQIEARVPGVMSIRFESLATEEGFARVFEHCLPYQHDHRWWDLMAPLNLQVNMGHVLRHYAAYRPQLDKLAKIAKHRIVAGMARPVREPEGVTIQQEPFDTFYRDGQRLFADHLVQVGEAPDDFAAKNIPLMRVLDDLGCMQITTARSNGRMFGYLMAILSPSLESTEKTWAIHTTFFASKEFHGLGMKMQRASVEALRNRGVDEAFWRAGPRGDGPRMGALYRRLGAVPDGELFKLELDAA